ncbi:MAG TPA: hypothetical protein PK335_00100 [Draconibacterium sp.]|nr:hypothetical protein [Draconibacterium sp.]
MKLFLKSISIVLFLCLSNALLAQTTRFSVGIGGFVKHSFPNGKVAGDTQVLGYTNVTSKTLFLEPGYELNAGFRITTRLDLILGINSTIGHLTSSPYYYELNFQQINFPVLARYLYSIQETHADFFLVGISLGKILQRELSSDKSTWQHNYLEDWNDVSPFSLQIGWGRKYQISGNSNIVLNPYVNFELSDNKILKTFFAPFSLGLKISYEFKI